MVKAGSLYFALFISFIVTVILGSLILFAYFSNRYMDLQIMHDQIRSNADAGITLALYDTGLFAGAESIEVDLFNEEDSSDNIILSRSDWGIYRIFRSTARWKKSIADFLVMAGSDISTTEPIALYMADNERYLSLSGNTRIAGNCYLPVVGVKTAYVEGQNYNGDELIYGETKTSARELPSLLISAIRANLAYFRDTIPSNDTLVEIKAVMGMDSITRSFKQRTLVIYSSQSISLDGVYLSGNIKILSSRSIYVTENTNTENIILYAPKIYFGQGFRGSLQAFAQDSLIAGKDCIFEYPSCLGLISENINGIYLELNSNSQLLGSIFLFQENRVANEPFLLLAENSNIQGQVYCPGKVEIKGTIEGTIYCHGFMMRTSSGLFENHLLNVIIDRSRLSENYAGSLVFPGYQQAKAIQWLN